jgi:hypothetical protein
MTAKNVDLVIRAKDQTARALNSAKSALNSFATAQQRTAQYRGLLQQQRDTATAAKNAALELKRVGLAASGEQVKGFRSAQKAARDATTQVARFRQELAGASSATPRGSFAAFDEVARGAQRADTQIEQLAAAQTRATVANNASTAAVTRNAAAIRAQGNAARLSRGPLGLRPHELQNLGFQVNDIVSGLAMGQRPMQVLAQQGGQVAQIFPRATVAILKMLPVLGLVAAAVTPVVAAFRNLGQAENDIRSFGAQLEATADAALYSAEDLAALVRQLDVIDGSASDARGALQAFTREGIDDSQLLRFGVAAQNLARVTGTEIPEAAQRAAKAFSGTYDDVKRLDDELNFLTVTERAQIREMFESGRASDARTRAFNVFFARMESGASQMRGPWKSSIDNLAVAWNNFLGWLENTAAIQGAINKLRELSSWARRVTGEMNAVGTEAGIQSRLAEINENLSGGPNALGFLGQDSDEPREWSRGQNAMMRERARLEGQLLRMRRAARPTTGDTIDEGSNQNLKTEEDRALEAAARGSRTAANEAQRRAEAQANFLAGLQSENEARQFQLGLIGQAERQQRIATTLREAETRAAAAGVTLSEQQRGEIERTVSALYDAEQAFAANQTISRASLELARQRGDIETRSAFVARKLAEDSAGWTAVQREAYAAVLGDMYEMDAQARQRSAAEAAVNAQLELRRQLMESIAFYEDAGEQGIADGLRERMEAANGDLLAAVDVLIAYWSAQTGPEAEAALAMWERQRGTILEVGKAAITSGREISRMIAEGGASAFDRFAESVADGANAFRAAGDAFRAFAADFLRRIGQMIVQQMILNAVSGAMGGPKGGIGGKLAGWVNAAVRHDGGLANSTGSRRAVNAGIFANATRYHVGGIAGLRAGEVPAILKRGEEVLTEDDPRHVANGRGSAPNVTLRNVNVFDAADMLSRGLATESGEREFLNFVNRNAGAIKAAIG